MLSLIMTCTLMIQEKVSDKPISLKTKEGFVFVESNRKVVFATDKEGNIRWVKNDIANAVPDCKIISLRDLAAAQKTGIRRPGGYPEDTIFITTIPIVGKDHPKLWIFSGKDGKFLGALSD